MNKNKLNQKLLLTVICLSITPAYLHAKEFSVATVEELRSAIQESNVNGEENTINLSPGTYTLAGDAEEDNSASGDLDIRGNVTLRGENPRTTTLQGDGTDRVIHITEENTNVTLENLTITKGNPPQERGCGIFIEDASVTINNCTVTENTCEKPQAGSGAGIASVRGMLIISNSTISNNEDLNSGGGGIFQFGGDLNITNSTISGNISEGDGGGIFSNSLGQNSATATILNSTITDNNASGSGAGEGVYTQASLFEIGNTIIAGNILSGSPNLGDQVGPITSLGGNIIGASIAPEQELIDQQASDQLGSLNDPLDPMLGPLQDNGGLTDTHALIIGSPAIDMGVAENCQTLTADQRGAARTVGDVCDVGAFEYGCGDGELDPNEACDDGNTTNGDGCSNLCLIENTGNIGDPNATDSGGGCAINKLSATSSQPLALGLGLIILSYFLLRNRKNEVN